MAQVLPTRLGMVLHHPVNHRLARGLHRVALTVPIEVAIQTRIHQVEDTLRVTEIMLRPLQPQEEATVAPGMVPVAIEVTEAVVLVAHMVEAVVVTRQEVTRVMDLRTVVVDTVIVRLEDTGEFEIFTLCSEFVTLGTDSALLVMR